ncbi:hypothetical protein KSU77_07565 [Parabacteroides distasonis]|uniref:hypothetical protein n=1 Tax=Parabacteroides distasonis TaxID=823 RepID=UPI001C385EBF|nr:hypothetical protein [Parabacteroides distasonis]MBV3302382.1 hypothetical protein [Parabacteroides distasonis]
MFFAELPVSKDNARSALRLTKETMYLRSTAAMKDVISVTAAKAIPSSEVCRFK